MRLIPFNKEPLGEVRDVRFIKALGRQIETARIVSFGRCNYHCPYCKRDAQFVDENGNVLVSEDFEDDIIFDLIAKAIQAGERVRLSGGDPCMHPRDSLRIAEFVHKKGQKLSICHNGSSPVYIRKMAPYIEYAAIDLKASNSVEYALRAGVDEAIARKVMPHFEEVCRVILEQPTALLDARTCVFDTTSLDDLIDIATRIDRLGHSDRKFWTIRQYIPVAGIDWRPLPQNIIEEWIGIITEEFKHLHIGCRLDWSGGDFLHWYAGEKDSL